MSGIGGINFTPVERDLFRSVCLFDEGCLEINLRFVYNQTDFDTILRIINNDAAMFSNIRVKNVHDIIDISGLFIDPPLSHPSRCIHVVKYHQNFSSIKLIAENISKSRKIHEICLYCGYNDDNMNDIICRSVAKSFVQTFSIFIFHSEFPTSGYFLRGFHTTPRLRTLYVGILSRTNNVVDLYNIGEKMEHRLATTSIDTRIKVHVEVVDELNTLHSTSPLGDRYSCWPTTKFHYAPTVNYTAEKHTSNMVHKYLRNRILRREIIHFHEVSYKNTHISDGMELEI